jgi:hypothetical protein
VRTRCELPPNDPAPAAHAHLTTSARVPDLRGQRNSSLMVCRSRAGGPHHKRMICAAGQDEFMDRPLGWSPSRPPELDWFSAPASYRMMASYSPRASWALVARAGVLIAPIPAAASAVYRVGGSGSRDGRCSACERPSAIGRGRDLRLSAPCPMRVQKGPPQARFRWSAPDGATPSRAVSAGSNPAGGTGQRNKFEHSDNLDAT